MAKVEKLIKFFTVCAVVFVVLGYICRELFKFIWNFDIFGNLTGFCMITGKTAAYLIRFGIAAWGCSCF